MSVNCRPTYLIRYFNVKFGPLTAGFECCRCDVARSRTSICFCGGLCRLEYTGKNCHRLTKALGSSWAFTLIVTQLRYGSYRATGRFWCNMTSKRGLCESPQNGVITNVQVQLNIYNCGVLRNTNGKYWCLVQWNHHVFTNATSLRRLVWSFFTTAMHHCGNKAARKVYMVMTHVSFSQNITNSNYCIAKPASSNLELHMRWLLPRADHAFGNPYRYENYVVACWYW